MRSTHGPAGKAPVLPLLVKLAQHFAIQLILIQEGLHPVSIVLQVLQQHLQVPGQKTGNVNQIKIKKVCCWILSEALKVTAQILV